MDFDDFRDRLRVMRELMGLDRKQMAALLGITYQRYYYGESKQQHFKDSDVVMICQRLPEFVNWLVLAEPIDKSAMEAWRNAQLAALSLQMNAPLADGGEPS